MSSRGTPRRVDRLSPRAALTLLGLFALLAAVVWLLSPGPAGTATVSPTVSATVSASVSASSVPAAPPSSASLRTKARYVLAVVDTTGQPPRGYVGGRQFMNDGRGGTAPLPRRDAQGAAVTYREYDVNPKRQGVDRGPQRLVVGSDGSAFATGDHYVTWTRLR